MYRLSGMTYNGVNETRGYNGLNQLTSILDTQNPCCNTYPNISYNYPAGADNGKISSMSNAISGETVTYTYDSLNRLLTAAGSGWGESYVNDPFGNLSQKNITAGSAPSLSQAVNANNQIVGQSYDHNGNTLYATNAGNTYNLRYDVENRLSSVYFSPQGKYLEFYAYDAQNRRIWSWAGATDINGNTTNYAVSVYTPGGQKLATYTLTPVAYQNGVGNTTSTTYMAVTLSSSDQYFGGRRLAVMDRLGSAGVFPNSASYFPWGEARGSNPQDTWNFATYWQDSASGLDYANNRYYSNITGSFMTPDPSRSTRGPSDPQSWNRYAYTAGDPVNRNDPAGLDWLACGEGEDGCTNEAEIGFDQGFQQTPPGGCDTSSGDDCNEFCPAWYQNCDEGGAGSGTGTEPPGTGSQPFQAGSNQGSAQTCKPGYVYIMGTCLPYPGTVWFKLTLPGTNWCGPGGHGPTQNTLDAFCEQHDVCYAEADVSPFNNFPRFGGPRRQVAIHGCNVQLCKDVGSILAGPLPTLSSPASYILLWEDSVMIWDAFNCMSSTMKH